MIRRLLLLSLVASLALAGVATTAASAIETATFGIDAANGRTQGGKLEVALRAGRTTEGSVRVWNKTDTPITLQLSVAPVQVDAAGAPSLGGDPTPTTWVDIDGDTVALDSREEKVVRFEVRAPRSIDPGVKTLAIVAERAPEAGAPAAVVERVAVTAYLRPEGSLIASLGWFPWLALALLLLAIGLLGKRFVRRGRESGVANFSLTARPVSGSACSVLSEVGV